VSSDIGQLSEVPPSPLELLRDNPFLRIPSNQYNYHVTVEFGTRLSAAEVMNRLSDWPLESTGMHLYFHVPLCSYICHFCNFVRTRVKSENEAEQLAIWVDALIMESEAWNEAVPSLRSTHVDSAYLGGGTAGLLLNHKEPFIRLMQHIREKYNLTSDAEITVEGNPENFSLKGVSLAISQGANRFSVGVQSLDDNVNNFSNRLHSSEQTRAALDVLGSTDLPFNVDMIYGLPKQSIRGFSDDIDELCRLKVPTITMYRLRNNDRRALSIGTTSLWNKTKDTELFPSLEDTYEMRAKATRILKSYGYSPGPSCWWSLPGTYKNKQNIPRVSHSKWVQFDSMLAIGPGAYGWFTGDSGKILQYHNEPSLHAYAEKLQSEKGTVVSFGKSIETKGAASAALAFRFKAFADISTTWFEERYGVNIQIDEPFASVLLEMLEKGFLTQPEYGVFSPTLAGEALHEEIHTYYFLERLGASSLI
jgi:oxygen-independent coproporphyrinogen-3 oxidase